MIQFVDIHCHMLPAVDDGAKSMEDTKAMLAYAYEQGVRGICFTPHDFDRRSRSDVEEKRKSFERVQAYVKETYEDLHLWLGSEVAYRRGVEKELIEGKTLCLSATKYVLIEFYPGESYHEIEFGLRALQKYGYKPIVAHVERVDCLLKNADYIENLRSFGVLFQMNAESVVGSAFNSRIRRCRKLVKEGYIDCFGTDAHNMSSRKPEYTECSRVLTKLVGEDEANRLFYQNALQYLKI